MGNLSVIFVTQDDPIYVGTFWEEFAKFDERLKDSGITIKEIVVLKPLGKKSKFDLAKQILDFYGVPGTFKLGLKYLRKKFFGRGIQNVAEKLGSELSYLENVNSEGFVEKAKGVDLIFSVAASQIFKKRLLTAPKYGCFNIHSGPLPYYKGMMPVFWQMLDGKDVIGITIHKMVEKLDAGPVILQEFVDIKDCETLDAAIEKTKRYAAGMVVRFFENIGELLSYEHTLLKPEEGTYFTFPKKEHGKELRRKGKKLI